MAGLGELSVPVLMAIKIFVSVGLVASNKILFQTLSFPFVTFLSSLHFFSGFAFLTLASSPRFGMFKAPEKAPEAYKLWVLAAAGAFSIVLNNYSLHFNSLGSAQIFKAAVLPASMVLPLVQGALDQVPSAREALAAAVVVLGSCMGVVADVTTTWAGAAVGVLAVLSTAQYQLWSSSFQKAMGLSGTQLLHASSAPQGMLTLAASLLIEGHLVARLGLAAGGGAHDAAAAAAHGSGSAPDLFSFRFTTMHVAMSLATCVLAVALNWSVFSILGKTNAVSMQVLTQAKSVILITLDFLLFPKPPMAPEKAFFFVLGGATCVGGAIWYAYIKSAAAKPLLPQVPSPAEAAAAGAAGSAASAAEQQSK
jgi:hypothetical protein